jgi:hypothetical protein
LGGWAFHAIEMCAGRLPFVAQGYPDGSFGPQVVLSRDQMAVFILRAAKIAPTSPEEATFEDVDTDYWAFPEIEALALEDIVGGYEDGLYHPDWSVTRAQMPVFIARAQGYTMTSPEEASFSDVPVGYWAFDEIETCVVEGVVAGYPDGLYRPGVTLSRDQMAVFIYRAFIQNTDSAVVLAGPGLTDVNLPGIVDVNGENADWDGWSVQDEDPTYAYIGFDVARLGVGVDKDGDGQWEITFDFRDAATPAVTGTVVGTFLDPTTFAALTSTYVYSYVAVPGLAAGDYVLVVEVEHACGTAEATFKPEFKVN